MPDAQSQAQEPTGGASKPTEVADPSRKSVESGDVVPILRRGAAPAPRKEGADEPTGLAAAPAQSTGIDREAEAAVEAASFLAGKDPAAIPPVAAAVAEPPGLEAQAPDAVAVAVAEVAAEPQAIVVPTAPGQGTAMQVMVAAEVLRRVNRTRQVVSLVSQVIIRSYEEEALHAEVCRHLVTFGGYLMAWVGLAEEQPERIVRPVAHAGLEANFLHALKITWSNDLANLSPTSRAIQEQRPHVARNIPKEPRFAVLRDEAQLYGYTATCALPLQFAQYGLGVLTIHAAEPDAFGPEEVSLLRELANDLAAGIIGLRERAVRERLEELTRKTEERYRSIIDNAREGVFQSTPDGKLLLVNTALVRLLGYASKEELLAVQPPVILTHIHPDDSKGAATGMFVADGAEPFEARMRRKVGGWIWVGVIAKLMDGPDGPMVQGFVQDMTSKRGERIASERLMAVVDAAADAITGTDLDGLVTDWNAGATRLFGYTRDEVLGHPATENIVPAERVDEFQRVRDAMARGEHPPRFETLRRRKDGRILETSITVSPILVGGDVVGSTSVEHDLTQERAAEDARVAMELAEGEVAKREAIAKVRKTFISEASHELNTPLTPLRIHVEALGEDQTLTAEQRKHLIVIERNVLRIASLVKDMLEASRLETGRFKLELAPVGLKSLGEEVCLALTENAHEAGVTLEQGAMARVEVVGDRNRLLQVLYNLVANALNFTPDGGHVTVSVESKSGQAVVCVTDTGVGLDASQIPTLFQPFSRPNLGNSTGPKGTGLGLYISKEIIEQHGGRIWAESEGPGKGSAFGFSLPLTTAQRKSVAPGESTPGTQPGATDGPTEAEAPASEMPLRR